MILKNNKHFAIDSCEKVEIIFQSTERVRGSENAHPAKYYLDSKEHGLEDWILPQLQGVPYHWAHFVFAIFSGSRAHTEELFIAIG